MEGRKSWYHKPGGRVEAGRLLKQFAASKIEDAKHESEAYASTHPESVAKYKDYIEEIDFDQLQSIFVEIAVRSGIDPSVINFPPKDTIFIVGSTKRGSMAMYSAIENVTKVYPEHIAESAESIGISGFEIKAIFLHALAHEYTHATAKNAVLYEQMGATDMFATYSGLNMRSTTVEYGPDDSTKTDHLSLYTIFNEGITEHIAAMVGNEYIRRIGIPELSSEAAVAAMEKYRDARMHATDEYGIAIRFVDRLVAAISIDTGVPEAVVFRGLIRNYYRGDFLHDDGTAELLDESIGPGFTDALAGSDNGTDLEKLLEKYPVFKLAENTGKKWIDRLQLGHDVS